MKIYLVDVDNGGSYEDYDHRAIAAFTTFRSASQYLLDDGYKPYCFKSIITQKHEVSFSFNNKDEDGDWVHNQAEIIELELQK
jgi:hypothetical protein